MDISELCFVGIHGHNQDEVLRRGLVERGVTVHEAGVSTVRDDDPLPEWIPLYPMKPTLNWLGRFPPWAFPALFVVVFLIHALVTWAALLPNVGKLRRSDALVVPHLGDTAVLLVKPLAVLLDVPIVYISHNGLYFTLVETRIAVPSGSTAARFLHFLDSLTQSWADKVVVFSEYSKTVLSEEFGVDETNYGVVYISSETSRFGALDELESEATVDVLYWGNFIPHHGMETIVRAAVSLPEYEFVLAGNSDDRKETVDLAEQLGAENVSFPGYVPASVLGGYVRSADIVLGPLGDYTQTSMNIGTKVSEAASMRKAILLGDHPAPNEVFDDRESAMFVEPEDEGALADAIDEVASNDELRGRLERNAYEVYEEYFSRKAAARRFLSIIEHVTSG